MGELVSSQAGSNSRDLAALALDTGSWSIERAQEIGGDIEEARERLNLMARPAKEVEPNGQIDGKRGPKTDRLMQALRMLGAKIAPTMSAEQVNVWIVALTTALSDLPFAFSIRGAQDAVHVPMQFLNEVEGVVREKAEGARVRHSLALFNLRKLERAIEEASKPKLPPPPPPTEAEWREFNRHMRSCGLSVRFFFGEECRDEETGEIVPGALGNMRPMKEGEPDPALEDRKDEGSE